MYKSALFHLHSVMEGNQVAMSGYCYEAQRFGIDVVWISDHDARYFRKPPIISLDADYELRLLVEPDRINVSRTGGDQPGMQLRVQGNDARWRGICVRLPYLRKNERPPLVIGPEITLRLKTNIRHQSRNRRMILRLHLGQQPPDHRPVYVDYVLGAVPATDKTLPLPFADGVVRLTPGKDMPRLGESLDHNLTAMELMLESRHGTETRLDLESISLETAISDPHAILEAQSALARELGKHYGVTVFVNYEASGAEGHMTCFGPPLPIPYDVEKRLPRAEIARTMAARGGVVSINHPFSGWKNESLDATRKQALIQEVARKLIRVRADGARLLEVGFPEGRHQFEANHYFELLDLLNLAGLRMTAIGVSDSHANRAWDDGNNFANYLASPDCRQENLLAALNAGNHYMADPARVRGTLQIGTDQGRSMGEVQPSGWLKAQISDIPRGCEWRWVVDGRCVRQEAASGSYQGECALDNARHFVRAELWDPYERLILATNPVWTAHPARS